MYTLYHSITALNLEVPLHYEQKYSVFYQYCAIPALIKYIHYIIVKLTAET
jgi:hypothetical protein